MCRIMVCLSEKLEFPKNETFLFFEKLESSLGGDGNGLYLFDDKKMNKSLEKADKFCETISFPLSNFIFHTRKMTHGKKDMVNTQPIESENFIIAHNGIWSSASSFYILSNLRKTRFSDSYLISQLLEKIGILKFYLAFDDYGILIVYDKKTNRTYLLKSSGSFEWIRIGTSYIYASSLLDFWKHDEKGDFKSGMYLLEGHSFVQLHKDYPSKYVYSNVNYGTDYFQNYNYDYRTKTYHRKKQKNKKKEKKKTDETSANNIFTTISKTSDGGDNAVAGIESLFGDLEEKTCFYCSDKFKTVDKKAIFCPDCEQIVSIYGYKHDHEEPDEPEDKIILQNPLHCDICNGEIYRWSSENLADDGSFICEKCVQNAEAEKKYYDDEIEFCENCEIEIEPNQENYLEDGTVLCDGCYADAKIENGRRSMYDFY